MSPSNTRRRDTCGNSTTTRMATARGASPSPGGQPSWRSLQPRHTEASHSVAACWAAAGNPCVVTDCRSGSSLVRRNRLVLVLTGSGVQQPAPPRPAHRSKESLPGLSTQLGYVFGEIWTERGEKTVPHCRAGGVAARAISMGIRVHRSLNQLLLIGVVIREAFDGAPHPCDALLSGCDTDGPRLRKRGEAIQGHRLVGTDRMRGQRSDTIIALTRCVRVNNPVFSGSRKSSLSGSKGVWAARGLGWVYPSLESILLKELPAQIDSASSD